MNYSMSLSYLELDLMNFRDSELIARFQTSSLDDYF